MNTLGLQQECFVVPRDLRKIKFGKLVKKPYINFTVFVKVYKGSSFTLIYPGHKGCVNWTCPIPKWVQSLVYVFICTGLQLPVCRIHILLLDKRSKWQNIYALHFYSDFSFDGSWEGLFWVMLSHSLLICVTLIKKGFIFLLWVSLPFAEKREATFNTADHE